MPPLIEEASEEYNRLRVYWFLSDAEEEEQQQRNMEKTLSPEPVKIAFTSAECNSSSPYVC